jgi:putative membrane protein
MLIIRWILNSLALVLVSQVVPGITVHTYFAALMAALVLGLVNAIIRPVLLLLTLPVNILSLGLFTFFINGLMLLLVSTIVRGFDVNGIGPAFWGAIVLWLVSMAVNAVLKYDSQPIDSTLR